MKPEQPHRRKFLSGMGALAFATAISENAVSQESREVTPTYMTKGEALARGCHDALFQYADVFVDIQNVTTKDESESVLKSFIFLKNFDGHDRVAFIDKDGNALIIESLSSLEDTDQKGIRIDSSSVPLIITNEPEDAITFRVLYFPHVPLLS